MSKGADAARWSSVPVAAIPAGGRACQVQWAARHAIVTIPEHLNRPNADRVSEELLRVISHGVAELVVDMTATRTCDYSGADALARAFKSGVASGTRLLIAVESPQTRRVLRLIGLDNVVPMYASLEAALAASGSAGRTPADRTGTTGEPGALGACGAAGTTVVQNADVEVAVLDRHGVIVAVNQAWQAFAILNGGDPALTGVGTCYLDTCASARGEAAADQVAEAIRCALSGDLQTPVAIRVPCHSPGEYRWYEVLVAANQDSRGQSTGATVSLSLVKSATR